jgi:hypothetical protein
VVGVTLDPNLDSALEILLIASGIKSEDNQIGKKEKVEKVSYLDDDLSFIRNNIESIENNEDYIPADKDFTDIPAITRQLIETRRLKDLEKIKNVS